ncbi:MAG: hypothetical protein HEQ20_20745 [Aphanizomenon flos-aquae KM1D3_PB]|uniref:TRADD-N-associated membrane domain-containing protein n=1 Tax=Aphanizomenon flos-aquae TaxID=1176 RepID=UPI00126A5428|nr:hypothetical protein [Aphanizomenon flos-aquae]QSV72728.1 MAG: hypothetical protein HEQ20_20745 [Aphanizomenon flos-aquae KM1D3_PB]
MNRNYWDELLKTLHRQQKVVFYTWWGAKIFNIIITSVGIGLVFTGNIHDGSLTTVAAVLSQMSVGSFAKHNQSRLDKQIQEALMAKRDEE